MTIHVCITIKSIELCMPDYQSQLAMEIGITDQQREKIILDLIGSMSTVQAVKMVDQINKEIGE